MALGKAEVGGDEAGDFLAVLGQRRGSDRRLIGDEDRPDDRVVARIRFDRRRDGSRRQDEEGERDG